MPKRPYHSRKLRQQSALPFMYQGRQPRISTKEALVREMLWGGVFSPAEIAEKLKEHGVSAGYVSAVKARLKRGGTDFPKLPYRRRTKARIARRQNISVPEPRRPLLPSRPPRISEREALVRAEFWQGNFSPAEIARKLREHGITATYVSVVKGKLEREGVTFPSMHRARGITSPSMRAARPIRGEPILSHDELHKRVADALAKHGTVKNAFKEGFFPEYNNTSLLAHDLSTHGINVYSVRKQPEIADAKFRARKAGLKIIAKKALREHGTLANAFRKGALPARYRSVLSFISDLTRHDLSGDIIKKLYGIRAPPTARQPPAITAEFRKTVEGSQKYRAMALFSNEAVQNLRGQIKRGEVHERKPPDAGLLFQAAEAASYNAAVMCEALGIKYSMLSKWLLETRTMNDFDRGAQKARAREKAQMAEKHAKRQEIIKKLKL